MNLNEQTTVGEIAAENPAATRLFESHHVDFCCGGQKTLGDACRELGISAQQILAELEHAVQTPNQSARDWTKASLTALTEHIVATHHEYLKREMPRLQQMTAKVVQAHGKNHGDSLNALAGIFAALKDELDAHLHKEEMVLFPYITRLESFRNAGVQPLPPPFGTVANPIHMMLAEHDNAGHALQEMRRVTGDYTVPPDGCATYRALFQGLQEMEADLHTHIHLENNILFPKAIRLEGVK
jgi:regulator of cell morphogenesis and NO signaling